MPFLGFCRFTAADASTLLSAYGFHAFELDRLQNNRSNGQKETDSPTQNRETNLPGPFVPFTMFSRGSMDTAMHRSPELSSENGGTHPDASAEVIAQKLQQAHHLISIRSIERVISDFGLQKKTLRLSP